MYGPSLTRKTSISEKTIPSWHLSFTQFYFRTHPITLLLKILGEMLGGRMHGPSSHLKFVGTVPLAPPSLRPWMKEFLSLVKLLLQLKVH